MKQYLEMSEATLSDEYFVDDVLEELFANVSIDEEDTGDSTGEIQKKSLNVFQEKF